MKTHGEQWYENKLKIQRADGLDDMSADRGLPPKMERKEVSKHYNTKLFAYWMDQLDDKLSILRKSQIISALMFGHTETYKLFKELSHGNEK